MKSGLILFLLLVSSVAAATYFQMDEATPKTDFVDGVASQRSFTIDLDVVGVLDASQSHMVASEIRDSKGKIIYLIEDGVRVKRNDVLVRLDPGPYEHLVEQLRAESAGLEAAVQASTQSVKYEKNQVESEVANSKYNLNVAELEYKRLRDGDGPLKISSLQEEKDKAKLELQRYEAFLADLLAMEKDGYDNKSEISSVKEKISVYRDKLKTANDRYVNYKKHVLPALLQSALAKKENSSLLVKQTYQGGRHKIAKAEATLIQIESKLNAKKSAFAFAQQELANTIIKAPFDGIVIHYETFRDGQKRKPRVGDGVFPNQPILYLPDISQMIVKTKAREIDLHKLALGQHGDIRVDAYPDASMSGELTFIGALATTADARQGQEKFFQIIFTLNQEDNRFRPGMTCQVSIVSQVLENILTVPIQAVFHDRESSYCLVRNGLTGYERREVTTGAQNEDYIQIISGINVEDRVSLVKENQR
ncbi:MAG: HlyD family secretion protein [Desulforhopalus sp.]|jgi:HlyD family secretion protein